MSTEERVSRLEKAFASLLELARGADERMDTHMGWINELGSAQAETERKIAALVDAQIHTEEAVKELNAAQRRTESSIQELSAAQRRTEAALNRFIERADERLSKLEDGFATLARLAADLDSRHSAVEGRES